MIALILIISIINLILLFWLLLSINIYVSSDFISVLERLESIRRQLFFIHWKINKKNLTNKK